MKIFAVILILASSLIAVYTVICNENRHIRDLKTAIDLLVDVKNYAVQYLLPFRDIIDTIVSDNKSNNADYIYAFLSDSELSPPDAWKNAVNISAVLLNNREKEIIISFGESLCHCSKEQICEYSDKYIKELSDIYAIFTENKDKKIKTASALTFSAGLLIILMLV